jgi:hypothetical protein
MFDLRITIKDWRIAAVLAAFMLAVLLLLSGRGDAIIALVSEYLSSAA